MIYKMYGKINNADMSRLEIHDSTKKKKPYHKLWVLHV